ncbi:MAG: hypothetical protein IPH05_09855 [Flavobacteriales bacterium]|nr:hypothetical protein [Flavobacteriales bacterium]
MSYAGNNSIVGNQNHCIMRRSITAAALLAFLGVNGQSNSEKVFVTDPYESNGYFILDKGKMDALGADHMQVKIVARSNGPNGVSETTLETLQIDLETPYGHADASLIEGLPEGDVAVYSVTSYAGGDVVYERNEWNPGPVGTPRCQQVCSGNRYGWKMTLISDGFWTDIDFTNPGLYFYVPAGEWQDFKDNNPPGTLGLGAWYIYDSPNPPQTIDCFKLQERPENAYGPNGYPLPPFDGPVWAIRKDKGIWRDIYRSSHHVGLGAMCDADGSVLNEFYNQDADVQADYNAGPNPPGPVWCPGGTVSPGFDPLGDGLEVNCLWVEFLTSVAIENEEGQVEILEEVMYALHCEEGGDGTPWGSDHPLGEVGGIQINQWDNGQSFPMVSIKIPKLAPGKPFDPKLIQVKKTHIPVGLYEVLLIEHDGTIKRHFEEVKTPVTIGASYASYVSNTIYPVPVKDKTFAIDFGLAFPMDINLTIVDNMGETHHTKALSFEYSGRNKYVVNMDTIWDEGLYHAIFYYPDGSSETTSFIVDY